MALFVKRNPHLFQKISEVKVNPIRSQYINKLCQVKCKTALMQKSFFGFAPRIFNRVLNAIKNMTTFEYKRALNEVLITECYYTVDDFLKDDSLTLMYYYSI